MVGEEREPAYLEAETMLGRFKARGPLVTAVAIGAIILFGLFLHDKAASARTEWLEKTAQQRHEEQMKALAELQTVMKLMAEAEETQNYILLLDERQKQKLHLSMPDSLRQRLLRDERRKEEDQ